jgi:hypothetical protein
MSRYGELRGGVTIRPLPNAHDPRTTKPTKLPLLHVDRAQDFTFRIARTCDFSVGTAFIYCDLHPLSEPFFWLLLDESQWSQF